MRIRLLDPHAPEEIKQVAERMRETLIEVVGLEKGAAMYTLDWLEQRVRFHLDPQQSTAAVFVSTTPQNEISGHTIVRIEQDARDGPFGLFSTTYVHPNHRRQGIADALLNAGETWMKEHGLTLARTYTDQENQKLIALYEKQGYSITRHVLDKKMVILEKALEGPKTPP